MGFKVNALGSLNILESVRKYSPGSIIIYSSTNKVYGDLNYLKYQEKETRYVAVDYPNGFDESLKLDFHSPYGCSKGAADQYMLDYARIFGLKTVVFRHSSMYGGRQFATYDQGWIGWFCQKAIETKIGVLKEPFTISGNSKQVRDILYIKDVVDLLTRRAEYHGFTREVSTADTNKVKRDFNWEPKIDKNKGVNRMTK
jgi:CDP-paratose 2-epimerase